MVYTCCVPGCDNGYKSQTENIETGHLNLEYLCQRTKDLSDQEKIVTLMIDEVYTAQRVEYSNGSFVGLTKDGTPSKTVLAFMVQSAHGKYKDIVCFIPVNKLDTNILQKWFDKVMLALNEIFFVVSVDNHICNRQFQRINSKRLKILCHNEPSISRNCSLRQVYCKYWKLMSLKTPSNDDLKKAHQHLALLREQYVKLQLEHAELQRAHASLKATQVDVEGKASTNEQADQSLAAGLLKLTTSIYRRKLFSDIEIKLEHCTIPGHKFVLASRGGQWTSEYLESIQVLDLENIGSQAGEAITKWLYTDAIDLQSCTDEYKIQLMKTANRFKLDALQLRCEQAILSVVNARNCIQFYQLGEELNAKSLKDYCSSLVSMHWNDLTAEDFASMDAAILCAMFKSKSSHPLHRAIRAQREDVVFLYLIENDSQLPAKLNETDENGDWPLQLALSSKQKSLAETLVSHGVDVNGCDKNQQTHLHRALDSGDEFAAQFLINNGASVNCLTLKEGVSPLHIVAAAKYDSGSKYDMESVTRIASLLLKKGANPNLTNSVGRTPLHVAVSAQNMPVFKLLIESPKTDLEIRTREGHVALWLALQQLAPQATVNGSDPMYLSSSVYNDHCIAALLIKKSCDVNATHLTTGDNLLQLCIRENNEAGALFLARSTSDINHLNLSGISCLHTACQFGMITLTEYLLSNGADPNVRTRKSIAPLTKSNSDEMVNGVVDQDDNSVYMETPLHIAIRCQHHDVIQVFLEHKSNLLHSDGVDNKPPTPDFNLRDNNDHTVLALAVWSGFYKVAGQLLNSGADINYKTRSGMTLLHIAIDKEDISSSLFLLEHQANINIKTNVGESPLQLAVRRRLAVVVDALCIREADMNDRDANGDCPLWVALQDGQEEVASTLVRHGCDSTAWAPGPEGCRQTLLHRAIDHNEETTACFLIRSGCDLDSPRKPGPKGEQTPVIDGQTPLHLAASWGQERVVQTLLELNAEINLQDFDLRSALHIAVVNDHQSITNLLLAQPSINLTLTDKDGRTPFAAAMMCSNNKCAQAILQREPGAAEQMDKKGRNFLHTAVSERDLDSVFFLISIGSDVNSTTCDGQLMTPLHLAVNAGAILIVRNLILAGSNINAVNKQLQSALHLAAIANEASIASVLIENGADVTTVDRPGNNVFHLVALHGCLETMQILCQIVPQIQTVATVRNNRGQNPLHVLSENAKHNGPSLFESLLAATPDYPLGMQDASGNTALLLAYMNGHGSLCRSLVRSGSALAISNHNGINIFNHPVATKQMLFRLLDILSQEPPWVEGNNCLECGVRFGVATRKHHCRHCGRLLCSKCSTKLMPIIKFDVSKPTRVCDLCYDVLTLGGTH